MHCSSSDFIVEERSIDDFRVTYGRGDHGHPYQHTREQTHQRSPTHAPRSLSDESYAQGGEGHSEVGQGCGLQQRKTSQSQQHDSEQYHSRRQYHSQQPGPRQLGSPQHPNKHHCGTDNDVKQRGRMTRAQSDLSIGRPIYIDPLSSHLHDRGYDNQLGSVSHGYPGQGDVEGHLNFDKAHQQSRGRSRHSGHRVQDARNWSQDRVSPAAHYPPSTQTHVYQTGPQRQIQTTHNQPVSKPPSYGDRRSLSRVPRENNSDSSARPLPSEFQRGQERRGNDMPSQPWQQGAYVSTESMGGGEWSLGDVSEMQPQCTVEVVCSHPLLAKDIYIYYFESPRNGGGKVETVAIDEEKRIVHVTFQQPEVAMQIVGRKHRICGQDVEVTLYVHHKPRPIYYNKLLLHNVPDNTSKSHLETFLELVAEDTPTDILYADEPGVVVATFPHELDVAAVQTKCKAKRLNGILVAVSSVPVSNCVSVENLKPGTSKDTVLYYFESERNCGGHVEKVEMGRGDDDYKPCLVYFEDHTVVERVLRKQQHFIDQTEVLVRQYMECLGPSGGSPDPNDFPKPKPFILKDVDKFKLKFILQSSVVQDDLVQQLYRVHAQPKFSNSSITIECILTPKTPSGRVLARTWAHEMKEVIKEFLGNIAVEINCVVQQIWPEIETFVAGIHVLSDKAIILPIVEDKVFVVSGLEAACKKLSGQIKREIARVEQEVERKREEITDVVSTLKQHQLRLLAAKSFDVNPDHPAGLNIDINVVERKISFHGLMQDIKDVKIKMYALIQDVKSETIIELTDTQRMLLTNIEVLSFIEAQFRSGGFTAVWEVQEQAIELYAFSGTDVQRAKDIMQRSVVCRQVSVSTESRKLLQSQDWQGVVKKMEDPGKSLIVPSHDDSHIIVTATNDIIVQVMEEVESFIEENTQYVRKFRLSPSRQKFVVYYKEKDLQQIALAIRNTKISLTEEGRNICVIGTRKGVQMARTKLVELDSQILCIVHTVTDQAQIKLLTSEKCQKDLETLGKTNQCIVSTEPESTGVQDVGLLESGSFGHGNSASDDDDVEGQIYTAVLPVGIKVYAVKNDITQMEVDVIVNAANGNMEHVGGLAKKIVDKGGLIIQAECQEIMHTRRRGNPVPEGDVLVSGPGKLPCKIIIHAVGPRYRGGKENERALLHGTIVKCLETASSENHNSIAIPALSTGIFEYPAAEATQVIVRAVRDFLHSNLGHNISSIYLCDIADANVQLFSDALKRVLPPTSVPTASPVPLRASGRFSAGFRTTGSPPKEAGEAVASGGMVSVSSATVSSSSPPIILHGEIAKQQVDIIVNSTSTDMDLVNGAVSSSILAAAGPGLKNECKQRYPQGIRLGEVAITRAHMLKCREVYHIALPAWSVAEEERLKQVVLKGLTEASGAHHTSIAMPVLGTGNLKYPPEASARAMLGAVIKFRQNTPSSTLKDIRIIVYHADKHIMQAFQTESRKLFGAETSRGARQKRQFGVAASAAGILASGDETFVINGFRLIVKKGDITEEDTDMIVNSSNKNMDHNQGAVAEALLKKCGEKLTSESVTKAKDMEKKGFAITEAYNLKSRCILHLNADKYQHKWEKGILLCLQEAEKNWARSIAMPILGTGKFSLPPKVIAGYLFNALSKNNVKYKNLREVRVVVFDDHLFSPFKSEIHDMVEKRNASNSGGKVKRQDSPDLRGRKPYARTQADLLEVKLFIYTTDRTRTAKAVESMLDDIIRERILDKEICDPAIQWLELDKMEQIQEIGKRHDVHVIVMQADSRIVLKGMHTNVCDVVEEIRNFLQDVTYANMVQWYFLEVETTCNRRCEYDQKENRLIEIAYQRKQKEARLTCVKGDVYVINFETMKEYNEKDPTDTVIVIRSVKMNDANTGEYQLPSEWDAQGPDEQPLKLVTLPPEHAEFQQVQAQFLAGNTGLTLDLVERVQNVTLYRQYAAKKAHMDLQNGPGVGSNEQILWHGTASEAVDNINMYGFNRSYCGKNATMHGEGVYFAVNSSYSAQSKYSPPEPQTGKRHMYMCKVLVGHTVNGKNGMRVLPARQGVIKYDSATDNINNPWMYVIFNDTQAYPQYRIKFH